LHPGERLDPGIGDRNYLHLAPLSAIIRETVRSRIPGDQLRVLDLGCGRKPYAPVFVGRCRRYLGVDVEMGSAADVLAVGEHLPFAGASFDVVLCTQVLEHDPEPQRTVDEARRVLAKGGTLILSTHGVWFKHGDADYWRWTDAGLRRVMAAFEQVDVLNCGGQYSALFQLLNLYADPLPVGRRFLYLANNLLGIALDRILPAQNLISNYVAVARK
jgi:SAM-dependent methyltransferase